MQVNYKLAAPSGFKPLSMGTIALGIELRWVEP
jgi:hypothetical protein